MNDPFYPELKGTLPQICAQMGELCGAAVVIAALYRGSKEMLEVVISRNPKFTIPNLVEGCEELFRKINSGDLVISQQTPAKTIAAATGARYALVLFVAVEKISVFDSGTAGKEIQEAVFFGIAAELRKRN